MSFIHYKFRSGLKEDTLTFDGQSMRLGDLRDSIIAQKKILKTPAYTLEITNAQTKEVYTDDDAMVPKNTSVIVKRVPVQREAAVSDKDAMSKEEDELTELAFDRLTKTPNLASANASEESKIYAMIKQSTEDFDPSTYKRTPHAQYICHRCGKKGHHFVKNCPTIGDARFNTKMIPSRNPAGIPKHYIQEKMMHENNMIETLRKLQDKNSRFSPVVGSDIVDQSKVPAELQCPICQQLYRDVVVTPCCGKSYCDECIRDYLVTNDIVCICGETTSPDNLIPNKALRISVDNFRNQRQSDMKTVPSINFNSDEKSPMQPEITSLQNPPDLHSDASLNGSQTPPIGLDSPKKSDFKVENASVTTTMVPTDSATTEITQVVTTTLNQLTTAVMAAPIVVSNIAAAPTVIAAAPGSMAQHILPGSQALNPNAANNVIYTHRAQSSVRHPGYISYQTFPQQPGAPGIVSPALPYGSLNVAPGTIVRRLVPVPVGPRIGGAQAIRLHLPFGQQDLNSAQISELLRAGEHGALEALRLQSTTKKIGGNSPSPMPLTEDEFYLWQKQIKKRSRHVRRHSPDERTGRTLYRSRSRSRSRSNNKYKRRHHHDGSEDDRSHSKSKDRSKRRSDRKRRDSSQDSSKSESSKKKLKSKRHIPKHIQRELEEFEFDNEMEFDEELKRLKKESSNKNKRETSISKDISFEQSSSSSSASSSRSASPVINNAEGEVVRQTEHEKTEQQQIEQHEDEAIKENDKTVENKELVDEKKQNGDKENITEQIHDTAKKVEDFCASNEEKVQNDNIKTERQELSQPKNEEATQNKAEEKPKRKTKIIKRKVVRIVKVRRKKSVTNAEDSNSNEVSNITKSNSVGDKTITNLPTDNVENKNILKDENIKVDIKKKPEEKTNKKIKASVVISKDGSTSLDKKRNIKSKPGEQVISPSKVEITAAEVRAKKEAEKLALLEKAKRTKRSREAIELAARDGKNMEEEEKKRKREKYLALRKKQKEKQKAQESVIKSTDSKIIDGMKKPDQMFYKPGEAKLKSLSDQTKKRLKQSETLKKMDTDDEDEDYNEGDVLKSKVTSIRKIITPEKPKKKISISEDDLRKSQSGDDLSSRRVVKIDPRKRTITSTVHDSRNYSSRDSEISDSTERKTSRRKQEKEEQKWELKEKKRRQFDREKEIEEKKRMKVLEKEKQESYEREQKALREKERLERKLMKERQRFDEILRQKEEIKQRKQRAIEVRKNNKRKASSASYDSESENEEDTRHKSKKNNRNIIEIDIDSEHSDDDNKEVEDESDDDRNDKTKKKKKKNKKKKEKKKSSKRRKISTESEDEESDESESESHSEDEVKKKKKKKHRSSKKHKKRSKNKKHKKKSKKKRSRRQETSSEEEEESENEQTEETNEDEDDTSTQTEDDVDAKNEKQSEKDSGNDNEENIEEKGKAAVKKQKKNNESHTEAHNETSNDQQNTSPERQTSDNKSENEDVTQQNTESEINLSSNEVSQESKSPIKTNEEQLSIENNKSTLRKDRLESTDDIELDYTEEASEDDPDLLYGDLSFSENNRQVKTAPEENNKTNELPEDVEDGEIMDEDESCDNDKLLIDNKSVNKSTNEENIDEIYATQVDKAVDEAFNELVEKKEKIKER